MPYITQEARVDLLNDGLDLEEPGELNFLITTTVLRYIKNRKASYAAFNDVLGVLEAVKHELYRRMIAPYEDRKLAENGDVYPELAKMTSAKTATR